MSQLEDNPVHTNDATEMTQRASNERRSWREVSRDAREYLAAMGPAPDQAMTAWALGVLSASHCLHFALYLNSGDPRELGHEHSGGLVDGLEYLFTRRGAEATSRTTGARVQMTWHEVAPVVAPILARTQVQQTIRATLQQRRTLTPPGGPQYDRRAWTEIEETCHQVAADVWTACRPTSVQLDLFGVDQDVKDSQGQAV